MKERETAEQKYADIIGLKRPEDPAFFRRHPRMPIAERAKIFSPFAALRGHSEQLAEEDGKLLRQTRRDFSEEKAAMLSERLGKLSKGDSVTVRFFLPEEPESVCGYYRQIHGQVTSVDPVCCTLQIGDTVIPFQDLSDIAGDQESSDEGSSLAHPKE